MILKQALHRCQSTFSNLLLIAILVATIKGMAVERFEAVLLPDEGNGSSANSWAIPSGADQMELIPIAGSMTLNDGRTVPVLWSADPRHGTAMVTQPPIPANAEGEATAGTVDNLTLPLLCGTVTTDDGVSHATLWFSGQGGLLEALSLTDVGNGSRTNGLIPTIGVSRGDVVGDMTLRSGRTVPVVWTVDLETGEVTHERLPLPPGAEGTAKGLTRAENGDLFAVGRLSRNGRTRAYAWDLNNDGVFPRSLQTPRGADSMANGLGQFRVEIDGVSAGHIARVGAICDEVDCSATMWGPGGNPVNLHTNPNFGESVANSVFFGGGALTVVGSMTDAEGDVGAMFLPGAQLAADVNELLVNPDVISITQVSAIGPGGIMVGTGLKEDEPPINRGVIFIPVDGIFVPGQTYVINGSVLAGDVTSTWRDDDDKLLLRPERFHGQPTIVTAFESQVIGEVELSELFVNLLCNGRSPDPSSKFSVRVQLFNFLTDEWETASQIKATTTETSYSISASNEPLYYVDEAQRMRARLQIRRTAGSGRWEFEINGFMLGHESENF